MPDDKTVVITVRLPNDVADILKRRAKGNISAYLRKRLVYDVTRKHGKNKKGAGSVRNNAPRSEGETGTGTGSHHGTQPPAALIIPK
jgi:hypothetical protein